MWFEKLDNRLILEGILKTETALHIGSGGGSELPGELDLPILKSKGEPIIPGSSLKGVVRTEAEIIARSGGIEGETSCTPPDKMCGEKKKPEDRCIVCRIFGGLGLASKVKFRDCTPQETIYMETRPGITVSRERQSVKKGALWMSETVPRGSTFTLEIVADNLSGKEFSLISAALRSVEERGIGGQTSRGMGGVSFDFNRVTRKSPRDYIEGKKGRVFEGSHDEVMAKARKWLET